jgi:hypothetical protein
MMADFNPDDCDIVMACDPSQGSDVERVGKAQTVVDQARQDTASGLPSPVNIRQAEMNLFEALQIDDVDELLPEPDPGPSPQEKMMMEAQQKEIEFRERALAVDEQELQLKKFKMESDRLKEARDSALELSRLGLEADKDEAEITKLYAESLAKLVKDAGLTYDQAAREVVNIERDKIEGDHYAGQVPALNGQPGGAMAQ